MTKKKFPILEKHKELCDYLGLDDDSVGFLMLCDFALICMDVERNNCATMCEQMGAKGYGTLAIAAAIRTGVGFKE